MDVVAVTEGSIGAEDGVETCTKLCCPQKDRVAPRLAPPDGHIPEMYRLFRRQVQSIVGENRCLEPLE